MQHSSIDTCSPKYTHIYTWHCSVVNADMKEHAKHSNKGDHHQTQISKGAAKLSSQRRTSFPDFSLPKKKKKAYCFYSSFVWRGIFLDCNMMIYSKQIRCLDFSAEIKAWHLPSVAILPQKLILNFFPSVLVPNCFFLKRS